MKTTMLCTQLYLQMKLLFTKLTLLTDTTVVAWSDTNLYWVEEFHTHRPQPVNVWAVDVEHNIVGSFFIDNNLTFSQQLKLLHENIIPRIIGLLPNLVNPNTAN